MSACPWSLDLDVSVIGGGLFIGPHRIPLTEAPEFLSWLQDIVTGEEP